MIVLVPAALRASVRAPLRRGRLSLDVQYDLRNAIYDHLQRLDFASHDELQTGQLVSPGHLATSASSRALLSFLPIMLGNVLLFVVSLVVMVWLSPPAHRWSRWPSLPVLLVMSLRLRQHVFPATWDAQQQAGEVAGVVEEAVSGVRVVKGFGQEDRELAGWPTRPAACSPRGCGRSRIQARYRRRCQAIPALGQVGVLALGGWLAIEGTITLGTFLAFSTYLAQLSRAGPHARRPARGRPAGPGRRSSASSTCSTPRRS